MSFVAFNFGIQPDIQKQAETESSLYRNSRKRPSLRDETVQRADAAQICSKVARLEECERFPCGHVPTHFRKIRCDLPLFLRSEVPLQAFSTWDQSSFVE